MAGGHEDLGRQHNWSRRVQAADPSAAHGDGRASGVGGGRAPGLCAAALLTRLPDLCLAAEPGDLRWRGGLTEEHLRHR
ncbi:hypothetical protein E2651_07090 [Streptomyces sp. MZ04]|nr:hypothetical protein E2651_07090 [Streptomyces sp. MZ04]